jgi:bifunctional non-homologous end joining protein LigD
MAPRKKTQAEVAFSNLDKVFFPGNGFTKGELIRYYLQVAPVLLPHFVDRPVTRIRMPDGVRGDQRFYEKNAPGYAPDWLPRTQVPRVEGGVIHYVMLQDARALAWVANDAAIELHPFLHRADDISRPTHLAFDLDPGEGADLLTCIEVAWHVRAALQRFQLQCWPKVTGSKGLQLYVPLHTPVTYASVTPFAKTLAETLARAHPDLIVSNMLKSLRVKKVLIDWSQNHEKKTTVGAYSIRGKRDEPFVSTPVTWAELKRAEKTGRGDALFFAPADVLRRVAKHGDLFEPVLKVKQRLPEQFILDSPAPRRVPKALRTYAEKRDFAKTAEPGPAVPSRSHQGSRRRFVIQKHAASHLHYDLRLESGDTLKSWAVPKGFPFAEADRRSAFATEDHPLEYLDFEGTIAEGEYGGGTVMVWDIGTFDTIEGHYWKGRWRVFLSGKKLRGEWTLQKVDDSGDKPRWVLTKTGGDHRPVTAKDDDSSALTRRSMAEIARDNDAQWDSGKPAAEARTLRHASAPVPAARGRRTARAKPVSEPGPGYPEPAFVAPMLARVVGELPDGPEWRYEIKWDGWRGLGIKHGDAVRLLSRNGKSLAADFPAVVNALRTVRAESALLDGEVVALDPHGRPTFSQLVRGNPDVRIVFYAFDLLALDGRDWRKRTHEERAAKLKEILAGSDVLLSQSFAGPAEQVAAAIAELGLEGVIAKCRDAPYESGERSGAWVKLVFANGQEFVIGGYTRGTPLQSLVVGYHDAAGKLLCVGKVPGGLTPQNRRELHRALQPLESDVCPFANLPNAKRKSITGGGITADDMRKIQWVMPRLVAHVDFRTWTSGGNIRHSSFKGLREDKDPREVVREVPAERMA